MKSKTRSEWLFPASSLSFLILLALILYRDTTAYIAGLWSLSEHGEYAHGYLVLAISLYFVYERRTALASMTPCPRLRTIPLVMVPGLIWLAATLADVQLVQAVTLLLLALCLLWATLGSEVAGRLLFPVLFLALAIPVWSPLSPLLQEFTADVVFALIRFLEVPALRQEQVIVLPAGELAIEEACSGLRYLLAALTLGVLYADMNYRRFRARLVVVLIAAGVAVLANILRVFIVVYLGYVTDMQHPLIEDHFSLGWVLFGALVFVMLLIGRGVRTDGDTGVDKPVSGAADSAPGGSCVRGTGGRTLFVLGAVLALSVFPVAAVLIQSNSQTGETGAIAFPRVTGWSGPGFTEDGWMPVYHGAVADKRAYRRDGSAVFLYVGRYPTQSQGAELVNDLNRIHNAPLWRSVYPHARSTLTPQGPAREQLLASPSGAQRLVWYWYRVAGRDTASPPMAKLFQVLGLISGDPGAAVIAVATDIREEPERARETLKDFVAQAGDAIAASADGKL